MPKKRADSTCAKFNDWQSDIGQTTIRVSKTPSLQQHHEIPRQHNLADGIHPPLSFESREDADQLTIVLR